jgi:hypothetical protein
MPSFAVPIWYPAFPHGLRKVAKSISLRYGMLNVLKVNQSNVPARRAVRLFVVTKLIWLPARSPQIDCQLNEII